MIGFRSACLAVTFIVAAASISTAASAQYVDPDYGGYAARYYAGPGYYDDEGTVIVRRAPAPVYYGGYGWTPSRDTACTQDRRDFPERTNFICR
jgi:hypothetical protein